MQQKTDKTISLCLPSHISGWLDLKSHLFLSLFTTAPPKLDWYRVSLDLAMLAIGSRTSTAVPKHRSFLASLLPRDQRADSRNTPPSTTQNILEHQEPGAIHSSGNLQSQSKTPGKHWGKYILLLGSHEWAPFHLVLSGAYKHQLLPPSHQLPLLKTAVPDHGQRHPVLTHILWEEHEMATLGNSPKNNENRHSVQQKALAKHQVSPGHGSQ